VRIIPAQARGKVHIHGVGLSQESYSQTFCASERTPDRFTCQPLTVLAQVSPFSATPGVLFEVLRSWQSPASSIITSPLALQCRTAHRPRTLVFAALDNKISNALNSHQCTTLLVINDCHSLNPVDENTKLVHSINVIVYDILPSERYTPHASQYSCHTQLYPITNAINRSPSIWNCGRALESHLKVR